MAKTTTIMGPNAHALRVAFSPTCGLEIRWEPHGVTLSGSALVPENMDACKKLARLAKENGKLSTNDWIAGLATLAKKSINIPHFIEKIEMKYSGPGSEGK